MNPLERPDLVERIEPPPKPLRPARRGRPTGGAPATDPGGTMAVEPGGSGGSVEGPAMEGGGTDPTASVDLDLRPRAAPSAEDIDVLPPPPAPPAPDPRMKKTAGGGQEYKHSSFTATIKHDGTVEFDDHLARYTGLGFQFDLTDSLMAAAGDDAYNHQKLALLDATRDERLAMAAEACEERLDNTLYNLRADLEALWRDPALSVSEKKRTIFRLWDDCAEAGPKNIVDHGRLARATIVAFVARHLPDGSAFAFRADELVSLNETRHSQIRFNPYATGTEE